MTILIIIGVIAGLIFVHEIGHFIAAKLAGVKVLELGIGFPPRLFSFHHKETRYSLNILPFGGYAKLVGEDDPYVFGGLASKSLPIRLMVLGAGAFMNALLPLLLLAISFMLPQQVVSGEVRVVEVAPGSPAQQAGILPGDQIILINNKPVLNPYDLLYKIQLSLGKPALLEINRGGQRLLNLVVPSLTPPPSQGPLGIKVELISPHVVEVRNPPGRAFIEGIVAIRDTGIIIRNAFLSWISGGEAPQVGGPVAIMQITAEVARRGPGPLLLLTSFISLNLALLNLLPLPALDGGRIFFALIEGIRGKRFSAEWQRRVHFIGFIFLLSLILLITYFDLLRLIRGERFIP